MAQPSSKIAHVSLNGNENLFKWGLHQNGASNVRLTYNAMIRENLWENMLLWKIKLPLKIKQRGNPNERQLCKSSPTMGGDLEIGLNNELLQAGVFFVVESSSTVETLFLIVKAVDWTVMWCNRLAIPSIEGKARRFYPII
jgi:hypothetical protein